MIPPMSQFLVSLRDIEQEPREITASVPLLSADGHLPPDATGAPGRSPTGTDTSGLGVGVKGPIRVGLQVSKAGDVVVAEGRLAFDYERPCDRCGQVLPFRMDEKVRFVFQKESRLEIKATKAAKPAKTAKPAPKGKKLLEQFEAAGPEDESGSRLAAADLDEMTYSGAEIDLEPYLYELAALELPMRATCEMVPGRTCAVDPGALAPDRARGADPRWAVLKQLKKG